MTLSFKQFSDFISLAEAEQDQTPEKLDEIWAKILGKKKEDQDKKDDANKTKAMTALEKKKAAELERKKELQKKRDEAWAKAKDHAEGRTKPATAGRSDRDDYAFHRQMKEAKTAYSDEGSWKEDAKSKGYKVKKLSGELMAGDQTWGAFDGDAKVGEFSEDEDKRGGWLMEAKNVGFFSVDDASKIEKMELDKAKSYLRSRVDKGAAKADPANVRKAQTMIDNAANIKKLMFGVANFFLSADGKKVIR